MIYLAQQNKNQKGKLTNQQGSGSEYHKDHAGKVEGYGQPHPMDNSVNSNNENGQ